MATYRKLLKNRAGDTIIPVVDAMGDYSTSEIDTGYKWIDGKTIYKKTVDCGTLPNATVKDIAHNISNVSMIMKIEGIFYSLDYKRFTPLPQNFTGNSGMFSGSVLNMRVSDTNISIYSSDNKSAYSAYVTLYYTKTS